ncbi:MAG: Na+/H+ antiporter NhaA, partial [Acidobacteria bacterium]|nr:Na+/H+ antiporter NhaA [Acidobacteriota bacterium]
FHTAGLSAGALGAAVILTLLLLLLNKFDVRRPGMYLLIGLPLWVAVLKSGVHAPLAGVIVGLSVPARKVNDHAPAERLEHALHPWVAFVIVPLFALANAGVAIDATALRTLGDPLALGIVIGLFVGKQVGVTGGCWLVVRSGLASLPSGLGWLQIYGAGLLAGIGFTMALFIAALAFGADSPLYAQAKVAIVAGSLISSLVGVLVLAAVSTTHERGSSNGE